MKERPRNLERIYQGLNRELLDITIYDLIISEEKNNIIYSPKYQRNFVWNSTKTINFIESVLINGVIPPITLIKVNKKIEVIDGRQRYESLLKFYNNEFPLRSFGLEKLKQLDGLYYKDLPPNIRTIFQEYKMKVVLYTVKNLMSISSQDLELVKRDMFRRYNSGMTALSRSDVARAKYLFDTLTCDFINLLNYDNNFYNQCIEVLLPKSKRKLHDREKLNLILVTIRELLVMPYISIIKDKSVKVGAAVFDKYYEAFIMSLNKKELNEKMNEFIKIFNKLYLIKEKLENSNNPLKDNILFFKTIYWMFAILYKSYPDEFYNFNINQFYHYIENGANDYFNNYKNITTPNIEARHSYVERYISNELKLNISSILESIKENKKIVNYKSDVKLKNDEIWDGIGSYKQVLNVKDTLKINEIISLIEQKRFIIQPPYQRGEVKSKKKASRIIESIIIGLKLPPIYLYVTRGSDGLDRYTVLDGQQRLISILRFMGKPITNENYDYIETYKNRFALTGLKDLEDLNDHFYEDGKETLNIYKKEPIENYEFEVIRIDEQANPKFDSVDMFLRLNQNPCPISINSFEMWNSFDIIDCIDKIKQIAKYKLFKQYGNKMKEEELVTTLAYMHYQNITIENINNFFTIYQYLENKDKQDEHYEIKISIANKDNISNFLEDLEPGSILENKFLNSIDSINDFIDKLKILSEDNENILIKIFNPNIAVPRKGSKKDFYIMYLILQKLDTHVVVTYQKEILKDLEEIFKLMKNIPPEKNIDSFIAHIKNTINKYSKYCNKAF